MCLRTISLSCRAMPGFRRDAAARNPNYFVSTWEFLNADRLQIPRGLGKISTSHLPARIFPRGSSWPNATCLMHRHRGAAWV
jgi:hypothetical protein